MIRFFIYTVAENKMIGTILAKDWIDARLEASRAFGFSFTDIFACQNPLPTI